MGEAGTSKQGGRGRFYCARKYKRRNECVIREKETEGNSGRKKNQKPSHRQTISLSYCSEAQLGENGSCGHRLFMVKGVCIRTGAIGAVLIYWLHSYMRAVYMVDTLSLSVFC